MAKGVVRTDNMAGTDVRAQLVSVKYGSVSGTFTGAAIENGNVVELSGLLDGEREIYLGITPSVDSALRDIVLIATPEVMYDSSKNNLEDFINPAGETSRGYRLHSGATFSVTKPALAGAETPAVGDIVELAAGTKLNVVSTATGGSTGVGKIIAIEDTGRHKFYVIEIN